MVSFTVLAGNFILINPERRELVLQAVSSLLAFSNLYLWKTTGGYWDASSENIALLHTWSLSLEEQFYFVLPFILVFLMHRYGVKKLFPILFVTIFVNKPYTKH
jgi:peptidoglycan/LPS O-acetylase OafA/YrhL